jgi:hypothetical protein
MSAYDDGYALGQYSQANPDYDARWDFADASKAGVYWEFHRGFTDGFTGKVADTPTNPIG